jgi:hypothetical protein
LPLSPTLPRRSRRKGLRARPASACQLLRVFELFSSQGFRRIFPAWMCGGDMTIGERAKVAMERLIPLY